MKNDTIRKTKEYGIAVLAFGLLIFISMVIDGGEDSDEDQVSSSDYVGSATVEQENQPDYIPNITPVDVYLNLEKVGFATEKDLGSKWGNFWTCTSKNGGLDLRVEISSKDVNKVQSIDATVMNQNLNESEAKQFLKYVASILSLHGRSYESEINNWIDENYNRKEAERYIDGVYLKLSAPSVAVRMLLIDSNPNDGM